MTSLDQIPRTEGRRRRRLGAAAFTALGLFAVSIAVAPPASAAPAITVTPDEMLEGGDVVEVSGSDLPEGALAVTMCGNADGEGAPLAGDEPATTDCNGAGQLGDGGVVLTEGPSFTVDYTVRDTGIGDAGRTCISVEDANFPCVIVVGTLDGQQLASAPVYFGEAAPGSEEPPPPPPTDEAPPAADPLGEGGFCENAPEENPFTDLEAEAPSTKEVILCLVATELTTGTSDTEFTPGGPVNRRQMALFVKRLADLLDSLEAEGVDIPALPAYDGTSDFTDVEAGDPGEEAIGQLSQAEIVGGITADMYGPNEEVSRRQMAAFIVRLLDFMGEAPTTDADYFSDDNGDSGEANLNIVASLGIFVGDGEGNVGPGETITRRQMANVVLRVAQVVLEDEQVGAPFVEAEPPAEEEPAV